MPHERISVYISSVLKRRISVLPQGTVSSVCCAALRRAVEDAEALAANLPADIIPEDESGIVST